MLGVVQSFLLATLFAANTMATLSFVQLEQTWVKAGGNPALAPLMAAIALAESGGNPNALNPNDYGGRQSSYGLWQISTGTHTAPSANWNDPTANAKLAVAKYNTQGLKAWSTYTSGAYRKYLPNMAQTQILSPLEGAYKITTTFYDKVILGPRTGQQHNAVDYSTPVGTPIYAITDGIISRADNKDVWGGNIIQLDGGNITGIYAHLQNMYVKPGDTVKAGQIIGTTGNTGKATTGPHLYFETRVNGIPVDPQKLINGLVSPATINATLASASDSTAVLTWLQNYFKDHKSDIGSRTWGDFFNTPNPAFIGMPIKSSYQYAEAIDKLGWADKTISITDFPVLAAAIAGSTASAGNPLDWAAGVANFFGAVLNPGNWAKILAIGAGAGMVVWGGIIIWQSTGNS